MIEKAKPWGNGMGCGAGVFAAAFLLGMNEAQIGKKGLCSDNFEVMALVLSSSVNRRGYI